MCTELFINKPYYKDKMEIGRPLFGFDITVTLMKRKNLYNFPITGEKTAENLCVKKKLKRGLSDDISCNFE